MTHVQTPARIRQPAGIDVARAAQLACLLEVSAAKPGNVSPERHFADIRYEHFLASAVAIREPFTGVASRGIGATVRLAIEARATLSPDALTGLEANLRFAGPETLETKIFGRLTAWQNWIFQRPNAVGDRGALRAYGKSGARPEFDWKRT